MVRPTTGRPCRCKRAATAEESTPPDMATATRPRWVSARSGNVSNWVIVVMLSLLYRATSPFACTAMVVAQHAAPLQRPDQSGARGSLVGCGLFAIGGGKFAELSDGGGDHVQGEVDVGGSGVAAEAEAQTGAGFLWWQTNGGEDVRWFDGAGGAGGPGGAGETFEVEGDEEGFAFDAGENKIRSVGSAGCGGGVHAGLGNALYETLLQFVAKCGDAPGVFGERVVGDFCGFAEAYYAGDVFRAGAEAALVMSAVEKLAQPRSTAHV